MKKTLLFISCMILSIILSGCSMSNTPTKQVEEFLDNYTSNNEDVLTQLKDMVSQDSLMNDDQRKTYTDIMKKQYKDLTYEIKDERIDGDNATVTAEIEVYDYYKLNQESQDYYNNNKDEFSDKDESNDDEGLIEKATDAVTSSVKYVEYRLNKLKDAKDRIKYTIDFTLTKKDGKWVLNDIDDATRQKIHGLYSH